MRVDWPVVWFGSEMIIHRVYTECSSVVAEDTLAGYSGKTTLMHSLTGGAPARTVPTVSSPVPPRDSISAVSV